MKPAWHCSAQSIFCMLVTTSTHVFLRSTAHNEHGNKHNSRHNGIVVEHKATSVNTRWDLSTCRKYAQRIIVCCHCDYTCTHGSSSSLHSNLQFFFHHEFEASKQKGALTISSLLLTKPLPVHSDSRFPGAFVERRLVQPLWQRLCSVVEYHTRVSCHSGSETVI